MKLFDKFIRELGNIAISEGKCYLCEGRCKRTIEIAIHDFKIHYSLLHIVLCEDCFKEALKVILDE